MPVTFTADPQRKILHSVATGLVSYDDLATHLRQKAEADVLSYAELFDARNVNLDLSLAELHTLGNEVSEVMGNIIPARIAVLTDSGFIAGLARAYQAITKGHNPNFEVFTNAEQAEAWIADQNYKGRKRRRTP